MNNFYKAKYIYNSVFKNAVAVGLELILPLVFSPLLV